MNTRISISFPIMITYANTFSATLKGILGTSYLLFKPMNTDEVVLYQANTDTVTLGDTSGIAPRNALQNTNIYHNVIYGNLVNNCLQLKVNGILVTTENSVCINDHLILPVPATTNPDTLYQSYLTFPNLQGTLICNYTYGNEAFTIHSIYFNMTRNGYFTIKFDNNTLTSGA